MLALAAQHRPCRCRLHLDCPSCRRPGVALAARRHCRLRGGLDVCVLSSPSACGHHSPALMLVQLWCGCERGMDGGVHVQVKVRADRAR